ncbi:MAG: helix-turn-helix domain-containing protein [Patescibacteria group bacterium]
MENIFNSLGIGKEEAETYLALLEFGPISVGKLAKKIGKPRPSLYGFLKRLQEKGLVTQSSNLSVKIFQAQPPKKVDFIFQQMIDNITQSQKNYQAMIPMLEKNIISKFISPKFQMYEGKDALKNIMRDVIVYSAGEFVTFWPPKPMIEILTSEFFEYTQKKRVEKNVSVRALWPIKQKIDLRDFPYMESSPQFKREVRFLPKEINFSMGFMIYGNKVAFISSRKENVGFIIESQEFAEMLKSLFEFFWNYSKTKKISNNNLNQGH